VATVANLFIRIAASSTEFEKTLKNAEAQFNKSGAKFQAVGATLTKSISLPLAAAAGSAIKFSMDFEKAMTKTVTLAGESSASMQKMRVAVLDMSKDVGIGPTQLAEALVAIESTGFTGARALEILKASAMGSAIGMGEAADVGRAITAVVNAYGEANITAAEAADQLHQTVLVGGADADTLAGELGRVVGVASSLGVSFAEVGAFIATYTKLGLSAAEATTGLSGVLNTILSPSKEARNALEGMGMSAEGLRQQVAEEGLGSALTGLIGKLQGNADATGALFGNVRALAGVMGTAGTQAESYRANLEKIQNSTGSLSTAFKVWEGTTAATWAKFIAGAQAAAIQIGDRLAPAFSKVLQAAMPLVDGVVKLVDAFSRLPQPVQTTALAFLGIIAAAGPIAYVVGSVQKLAASFAGLLRQSGIAGFIGKLGLGLKELVMSTSGVLGPWQTWLGYLGNTVRVFAPIVGAIGGVATAVGGLIYLIKEITGSWTTAFTIILPPVGMLMSAWQQLTSTLGESGSVFGTVWQILKDIGAIVANSVGPVLKSLAGILVNIGSAVKSALGGAVSWVADKLSVLKPPVQWLIEKISWLLSKIPKLPSLGSIESATGVLAGRGPKAPAAPLKEIYSTTRDVDSALALLDTQLDSSIGKFNKLGDAGAGAGKKIKKELLEATRAVERGHAFYTGPDMGNSTLGGMMGQLRALQSTDGAANSSNSLKGSLGQYNSLQDLANQFGMSQGATPNAESLNVTQQATEYAAAQMAQTATETVDGIRSAFQYFTGSLSSGMAALLGGAMNILSKGIEKSQLLKKVFGKFGKQIGVGMDSLMAGFGFGEAFGTGKGALAGAGMGAASGAMVAGPIGALVGGIAGLFGGIFGGKKKKKEEAAKMAEAKSQLLDQFGGMEGLQKAAGLAGVSVSTLFATDNAKVFQAEIEKVTAAIQEMQKRVAATVGEIDKVMAEGGLIGKELWQSILADKDAEEIKAKLQEVFDASVQRSAEGFTKIASNFELLKRPINEIGVLADAAFAGLLAGGASIPEAIAQMGDGLAHIQELLAKSGEGATGPLAQILNYQSIVQANAGLFELISGVDDMIVGLGNSGLLTQERFAALGATIAQSFTQLQAQGVAGSTALELLQAPLQRLWEAQQTFGVQTDAATQALIDQAVTQGIVGQNMKDVNSQILDVLKAIANVLGADIPGALGALPAKVTAAATAFTGIKIPDIRVGIRPNWKDWDWPEQPDSATGGTGVRPMATGGIVTRPTHALIGEAGPEAVIPLDEWREQANINVTVNGTADRDFARVLARQIALGGDVRTSWQGALS
jgi:TP901 family phage tail tape measure protein